jgi:hypothetical protein
MSSSEVLRVLLEWKLRKSILYGHFLSKGAAEPPFSPAFIEVVNASTLQLGIETLPPEVEFIRNGEATTSEDVPLRHRSFSLVGAQLAENVPQRDSISSTSAIVISWSDGSRLTLWEYTS